MRLAVLAYCLRRMRLALAPVLDAPRYRPGQKKSGRCRPLGVLLGERGECRVPYLFDWSHARDLAVFRGAWQARLGPVVVIAEQHFGLVMVDREALLDGFFLVVVALHQRLAGDVVDVGDFRRVELGVVHAARG